MQGRVVGQERRGRLGVCPVRREFFGFAGAVHPRAERVGARGALEQKQHVAHVVSKFSGVNLVPACPFEPLPCLVDRPLLPVVLARLGDPGAALS